MRPQDVAILLKVIALADKAWQLSSLSYELHISISEISESLNRSRIAKLIDFEKKNVSRHRLLEFLEHGVKYVFPQQPGTMTKGIATAHSHASIKHNFVSDLDFVWPDMKGDMMGLQIEPFYPKQVLAAKADPYFYELMALMDVVRLGKIREVNYAVKQLKKYIADE